LGPSRTVVPTSPTACTPSFAFLQVMGKRYPYDCVELHEYARPPDIAAPLLRYEEGLMAFPAQEGSDLAELQSEIHRYAGRDVPVLVTEYGQLVAPVPATDPEFNLSLEEGLLIGAQLVEWIDHGVPVAEKYLADSDPCLQARLTRAFDPGATVVKATLDHELTPVEAALSIDKATVETGLSADNAMVVGGGQHFVAEPTGEVLGLMSNLAGEERLSVSVVRDPRMGSRRRSEPDRLQHALRSEVVRTASWAGDLGRGSFQWTFPAHSLTLVRLAGDAAARDHRAKPPISELAAGPGLFERS
jgi:alpha-L-arabinofuranosidase